MNAFSWSFIGVRKRWSKHIFNIENILRSTLSYPNETSKEYFQFLNKILHLTEVNFRKTHFIECFIFKLLIPGNLCNFIYIRDRRGHDRMVVGFTTTYALTTMCLSPLMLWVRITIRARCTTLCDNVCQWLATGLWFSPVSSTNKTDRHDITEILLKVAFKQTNKCKVI